MAQDASVFHPRNENDQSEGRAGPEVAEAHGHMLPAPDEGDEGEALDVSTGETKSMSDQLGPLVVREDGQLERIANWSLLSEHEKAVTLRRITKRNRERLSKLRSSSKSQQPERKTRESAGESTVTDENRSRE